ncbi:MAG: autotransporter domain-containing protein [Methylotenera sp.]|nr:autotransporter domain-containing protein [Methylotenera sp.]
MTKFPIRPIVLSIAVLFSTEVFANSCLTPTTTISGTTNDECALPNTGSVTVDSSGKIINSTATGNGNAVNVAWSTGTSIANAGLLQADFNNAIYNMYGGIDQIVNSGSGAGTGIISTANSSSAILNFGGSIGLINNSGLIQSSGDGDITPGFKSSGIYNSNDFWGGLGAISTITNTGVIEGLKGNGITNESGTIGTITNTYVGSGTGIIRGGGVNTSGVGAIRAIMNMGAITTLTNGVNATIEATPGGSEAIFNGGSIGTLNNSGSIAAAVNGGIAIYNPGGTIDTINNTATGSISSSQVGIFNDIGTITTLTNAGIISGGSGNAQYGIDNSGTIGLFTNTGLINGSYGINNRNVITTLNNAQSNLTYRGALPVNYNIIINSTSNFGKLEASSATGTTAFGIAAGSTASNNHLYSSILSGVTSGQVTNTSGTYSGYNWLLSLQSGSSTVWDLLFGSLVSPGPSIVDTQASLRTSAVRLRNIFNVATISNNFANMNTYDCNLFDTKGMCISAGGRYTSVDNPSANFSSAVVVVGYKATPNIRIGGFLDQNVNNNTPSGINISNKNPLMGAFVVWNQNQDGLGYQVKLANAYQDKNVDTTRDIIGSSEAGKGSTDLTTKSYVGELSYAFKYNDKTLLRPYIALRHTTIKQDAYTEDTTALVTAPLTYAAIEDKSTAALLGIKLNHALTPKANLTASLGIEQDLNHKVDQYAASGVSGLTSENFNDNIKHTRPVASLGAYYAVTKTQRISGDVYYQQLPFQSTASTTAYFNYTIGF